MTQIIVINDTGGSITAQTDITLDGINNVPPIKKVRTGSLVNLYNGSTSAAPAATPTVFAETAASPSSGNYVYLSAENKVQLGVAMKTYQMLVLDVVLKDELIRT